MAVFMNVMNKVWRSKKAQYLTIVMVGKLCITVVVEETCVVAWALICLREDNSELNCLMVSAITRVWIGWGESRGKGKPD